MSADINTVLLNVYSTHRKFFYLDYFQNFKLFASWLSSPVGSTLEAGTESIGPQLPWYSRNYEIQELAKILKCTERDVQFILIQRIYHDY